MILVFFQVGGQVLPMRACSITPGFWTHTHPWAIFGGQAKGFQTGQESEPSVRPIWDCLTNGGRHRQARPRSHSLLGVATTVCSGVHVVEHQPCLEKRDKSPIPAPGQRDLSPSRDLWMTCTDTKIFRQLSHRYSQSFLGNFVSSYSHSELWGSGICLLT